jgi:CBS domain containing-hemolysin-like protein
MINSIVEFGDTIVREVMIPRIDMVTVEKGVRLGELLETIIKHGHSRIPVYEGNIDNIIGLIHGKDLLRVIKSPEDFDIMTLLRPAYFVPEEKLIDSLLREFQSQKTHMAIVVDEYGGTAGLVTLEDIIEEIFGEIQDEYDKEQPLFARQSDDVLIVEAVMSVDDFNEEIGEELIPESDGYDTVGGFIYNKMGVVPKRGEEFSFGGYRFIVDELHGSRITRVKVVEERMASQEDE